MTPTTETHIFEIGRDYLIQSVTMTFFGKVISEAYGFVEMAPVTAYPGLYDLHDPRDAEGSVSRPSAKIGIGGIIAVYPWDQEEDSADVVRLRPVPTGLEE